MTPLLLVAPMSSGELLLQMLRKITGFLNAFLGDDAITAAALQNRRPIYI